MLGASSGQSFPSLNFPRQQRPETTRDSTELRTPVPDGGGGRALGEGSAGLWKKPEQTVLSANRHVLFVLFCLQAHGHRPSQQHILAFPLKVPAAWLGWWGEADSSSWCLQSPGRAWSGLPPRGARDAQGRPWTEHRCFLLLPRKCQLK